MVSEWLTRALLPKGWPALPSFHAPVSLEVRSCLGVGGWVAPAPQALDLSTCSHMQLSIAPSPLLGIPALLIIFRLDPFGCPSSGSLSHYQHLDSTAVSVVPTQGLQSNQ